MSDARRHYGTTTILMRYTPTEQNPLFVFMDPIIGYVHRDGLRHRAWVCKSMKDTSRRKARGCSDTLWYCEPRLSAGLIRCHVTLENIYVTASSSCCTELLLCLLRCFLPVLLQALKINWSRRNTLKHTLFTDLTNSKPLRTTAVGVF
jgi:hypothetical protein